MGLDMYLYLEKEEYKSPYTTSPEDTDLKLEYPESMQKIQDNLNHMGIIPSVERRTRYKVGYWRKANAIHKWFVDTFVDGEDDCKPIYCDIDELKELLKKCIKIKITPTCAKTELPTTDGFFFGGTEYDDWYYDRIDDTITILTAVIRFIKEQEAKGDDGWTVVYEASW